MSVTPNTQGTQGTITGTAQVQITDPNSEVASVGFYVTGADGVVRGPFDADSHSGDSYQKEVILSAVRSTRVQPVVTLNDGSIIKPQPAMFGVRFEPIGATPGTFTSFAALAVTGGVQVTVARDANATAWRVWAALGRYPTVDNTALGALDPQYLRFDSDSDNDPTATSLTIGAVAGQWQVIAQPYNSAGLPGPSAAATVQVTS